MEDRIRILNDGVHPSGLMLVQVSTEDSSIRQLGAKLNRGLLGSVMSWGTIFIALLLREIERLVPGDDEWHADFDLLGADRRRWHVAEFGEAPVSEKTDVS